MVATGTLSHQTQISFLLSLCLDFVQLSPWKQEQDDEQQPWWRLISEMAGFSSEAQANVHDCYQLLEQRLSSAPSLQRRAPSPGTQDQVDSNTGTRSTAGHLGAQHRCYFLSCTCSHVLARGAMKRRLPGESSSTERKRLDRVSMFLSLDNDKRTAVRHKRQLRQISKFIHQESLQQLEKGRQSVMLSKPPL